jgi:hypothetical protein
VGITTKHQGTEFIVVAEQKQRKTEKEKKKKKRLVSRVAPLVFVARACEFFVFFF